MSGTQQVLAFMQISRFISALALLAAGSAALGDEQAIQNFEPSNYTVVIDGADLGLFPALAVDNGERVLRYDTGNGRIALAVGQNQPGRFRSPLTCFEFGTPGAVALDLTDINDIAVSEALAFSPRIRYQPDATNPLFRIQPASGSRCFYRGDASGEFGLFGLPKSATGPVEHQIFADRFEANEDIEVRFNNLPAFVNPGDTISYQLIVTNTGSVAQNDFFLHELVPLNEDQFDASLSSPLTSCSGPSGLCPPVGSGLSTLRFSGLSLGVGQSLTFNITRLVNNDAESGSLLDLYAAVASENRWDVAEEQIIVIGEGESLSAVSDGGTAGLEFEIEVTALDVNNNPVPFVEITVDDQDGLNFVSLAETTTLATGSAIFLASSETAGSYQPVFAASGLGTADAVLVVTAAEPDSVVASALVSEGTADGTTPAVVALTVLDPFLNPVPAVEVSVVDDDGLMEVSSPDPFTDGNGVATFQAFSNATGTFTIELGVTDVASDDIEVSFIPGAAVEMVFFSAPGELETGELFTVEVEILDAGGNRVTNDSQTEINLFLRQGGSTIGSLDLDQADQGLVTFTNLAINDIGTDYMLRAVDIGGNLDPIDSDPFSVVDTGSP